MSELDDLVESNDPTVEPVEEAPVEAAESAEAAPVEATGEEAEPPSADEVEEGHVPVAVLNKIRTDERARRQELEQRVAELQAQADAREAEPGPNPIDDPEGAMEHLRAEFRNEIWNNKVEASRRGMLRAKPDYADKEAQFIEMAQSNPTLVVEMRASEDPAEYAYETASKAAEFAQMQNIDEYKAKVRAEVIQELEAKQKAGGSESSQRQAEIDDAASVGALATARSTTGQYVAEDDLATLLDGR